MKITKLHHLTGHLGGIYTLCVIKDSCIISAGSDGFVVKWAFNHIEQGEIIAKIGIPIYSIYYIESLNFLAIGTSNGKVIVLDLHNNKVLIDSKIHQDAVFDFQFKNDFLYSISKDGNLNKIHILDPKHHHHIASFKISKNGLRSFVNYQERSWLITTKLGYLIEFDEITNEKKEYKISNNTLFDIKSLNNKWVCGGLDAQLFILNQEFEITNTINAHLLHIHSIAINNKNNKMITSSMDKSIKIWNAHNFELLKVINFEKNKSHVSSVNKILWIDENEFISCSDDKHIIIWKIEDDIK